MSHPSGYSVCMKARSHSAVSVSFFDPDRKALTQDLSKSNVIAKAEEEDPLMTVCTEIAGELIRRYLNAPDAAMVREELCQDLMEKVGCDRLRAQRLIELAMELIHVHCYGEYQRDTLELGLLIARAGDQVRDVTSN